ncbi:MAG: YitT family protein [Propionibacteriaceae bacterium]|nr:YitT family protein [Propionibacteriaceae bacterium]
MSGTSPAVGDTAVPPAVPQRHTLAEDIAGILTGVVLASLGLYLLRSVSAVTGGTAGLSLLLHYASGWSFSVLYVAVNLPFFALAVSVKGWQFTLRSLVAVVAVSLLSAVQPNLLGTLEPQTWYVIVLGNLVVGVGLLVLFRHRASLGGFGILALILQERLGWRAGYVQMALDVAVVASAFLVVAPSLVLWSALGAVVLNLVLALNHKPGRYLGF